VPVRIDHIALPCRDPELSARFLAGLFALPVEPDGADNEFRCVLLGGGTRVLFQPAASIVPHHLAFAVDPSQFAALVDALRARGIAHGNDPDAPDNRELSDPLGGQGRVYFSDPDGHLYEACC
jgi:catechol 2,3-dioxygenase-like lactoylglutathione lyase family enzyme